MLAAPDPDDEEHRDQPRLEEQVEQHEVERDEHADHQRLEHEEGDHVFLHPVRHLPGGGDDERHEEGREHHEEDRDAVHAHLVGETEDPLALLDKLEVRVRRIEPGEQEDRDEEGGRCRDEGEPLGVALRGLVLAPEEEGEDQRGDERQEGDDGDEVVHHSAPPAMLIQVMRTAIPITIQKA